jgi:hypothetical protein
MAAVLPNPSQAQEITSRLMASGYSAMQIAELLGQRVSWRTIYRWAKGESVPQRVSDEEALRALATEIEATPPSPTPPTTEAG